MINRVATQIAYRIAKNLSEIDRVSVRGKPRPTTALFIHCKTGEIVDFALRCRHQISPMPKLWTGSCLKQSFVPEDLTGKSLDSPEIKSECWQNVRKMSKKCPKNIQKFSGWAENTIFGHFLDNCCLFGRCFSLVQCSPVTSPEDLECTWTIGIKNESSQTLAFRVPVRDPSKRDPSVPARVFERTQRYSNSLKTTCFLYSLRVFQGILGVGKFGSILVILEYFWARGIWISLTSAWIRIPNTYFHNHVMSECSLADVFLCCSYALFLNREQKRRIRKNHINFLKIPWTSGCPWDTLCPGENGSSSIVNNRKFLGHRPVDPCLSRRVSQGHPAGVPGSFLGLCVRSFRNPCDRDPATRNLKNFKFFKNSQKYLTFTLRERAFTFGERAFTFGERAFTFGDNRGFRFFFWISFFVAGGFSDSVGRGGHVGVSENILGLCALFFPDWSLLGPLLWAHTSDRVGPSRFSGRSP